MVGLFEVVLVDLLDAEFSLVQDSVVGLIKVNLVSDVLVVFVDLVETISLCAEIFYRVDGLLELLGALCDPIAGELSAFAVDAGNEVLDLADVPLGGGEKHLLDVAGVDLEETDVGLLGEILTEVIAVEPEQLNREVEHVNR